MSSKEQLYQEMILDHFKHPRQQAAVPDAELRIEEYNPSCGDIVRLAFDREHEQVSNLHYEVKGCAISVASSSMMATLLDNQSVADAKALVDQVLAAFADKDGGAEPVQDELAALMTVKNFPMRLKCATLPWVAMKKVLE